MAFNVRDNENSMIADSYCLFNEHQMSSLESLKTAVRVVALIVTCGFFQRGPGIAAESAVVKQPSCERAAGADFKLAGVVANYLRGITQQWLLVAPDANPAMLEMFRDRDR